MQISLTSTEAPVRAVPSCKKNLFGLKCVAVAVLALAGSVAMAQSVPTSYILRGTGSGTLDGISFSQQPFTLAFEGLGENLTSGYVTYVPGSHPDWTWFSQDPLSRIVFSLPSASTITVVQDPGSYSLLAANFGAYRQIYGGGQTFSPFSSFNLCESGQGQYECWESSSQQFQPASALDFRADTQGRVAMQPNYFAAFDFMTTRGELNLGGIDNASLQIVTPIPEPETYALMLIGLAGVFVSKRRPKSRPQLALA